MKKNNNGKKKIAPVKPAPRRTGNNTKKLKKAAEIIAPAEGKIVNKIVKEEGYRNDLFKGLLTGLTFGLYRP
jgi:hypothetical protein